MDLDTEIDILISVYYINTDYFMEQKDKGITTLLKAYGLEDMYCKDGIVQDDKYLKRLFY